MVDENNVNGPASGKPINETGTASGDQNNDYVSHTTYKKTLTQLKNTQEKYKEREALLQQYQIKEQEAEKKRLEEQGEYKKLLEMERQQKVQSQKERDEYKKSLLDAHKLNAFNEKLPSKISNPKYYNFVDTDSIVIDPETGLVDETSVDNAVNTFVKEHHQLLDTKKVPLPSDSPSNSSSLSYEQWLKLPLKERRARMKEVYNKE